MSNLAIPPNPVNRLSKREQELHAAAYHRDETKPAGQSIDDWVAALKQNGHDTSPEAKAAVTAAEVERAEAVAAPKQAPAAPAHDKEMARRYLAALAPGATKYTFQFFSDDKTLSAGEARKVAKIIHGTLDEVWPKVLERNTPQRRVGVFVTINETDFKGRSAKNIIRGRALFADADSKEQATKCVAQLTACGAHLSMMVASGRGYHVYFCTDVPLDQFTPLQLQLITKLGTDPKVHDLPRVLRLPGTMHLKDAANPKLVRLLNAPNVDVPRWQLSELVSKLGLSLTAAAEAKQKTTSHHSLCLLPQQSQSPNLSTPEYQREIGEVELLDSLPAFKGCPFLKNALITGGKDHDQGLWMMTALATTFMDDGRYMFHEASNGHADYSSAGADAMFDRKEAEQHEKSLGWPSCQTFESYGSKQCKECPLKGTIRSPLNILSSATPAATQAATTAPAATPSAVTQGTTTAPAATTSANQQARGVRAGVRFRDLTDRGAPKPSLANARIAMHALNIAAQEDLFHHRTKVTYKGDNKTIREGSLDDATVSAIRSLINKIYLIDCGEAYTLSAIKEIARDNAFDPVLDYLNECQGAWDGVKRIETWVIDYLGVEDTPLNRAFGRLMLLASVRRAREPGCKVDQICVLEGPEGTIKSTAIRVLAGEENFSDQSVLNVSEREAQEQLEGIWLHESADLTGLKKADVEKVKAFASRQKDRARPAYGRVREDRPRRCTQWATTNDNVYLASHTGTRRFWPLVVGLILIANLRRDRDQLWGEAATLEAAGVSIELDPKLWQSAREEQDKRRISDPWEDLIENMAAVVETKIDMNTMAIVQIIHQSEDKDVASSADVLIHILKMPAGQQHPEHGRRLARTMKRCGWQSGRPIIYGKQQRGYWRNSSTAMPEWTPTRMMAENLHSAPKWPDGRKVDGAVVYIKQAVSMAWYIVRNKDELLGQGGHAWFGTYQKANEIAEAFIDGKMIVEELWGWTKPTAGSGSHEQN